MATNKYLKLIDINPKSTLLVNIPGLKKFGAKELKRIKTIEKDFLHIDMVEEHKKDLSFFQAQ